MEEEDGGPSGSGPEPGQGPDPGEEEEEPGEDFEEEGAPEEEDKGKEWPGEAEDDQELIERFLGGDDQAFARLVIRYQHKVHNLCFRILGDRDEAMDMAQEVFLTVHKSLKDFRGESLFSTWIFRVTVNHCKNRIKYLGRRKYYQSLSLDQPQELSEGEVYFELEDTSPGPESQVASEEVQELVQAAINSLDPDHRLAIILRDIQELSYEEIAQVLGIKVGTVKSRIHRARNELKKKLAPKLGKTR